ncbi:hypothetical protein SAMN04487830_1307 [Pseudobutyrivibrio sp. OR37]|uniref:hypothetical protein n=1 Tax=Pseudobutyrivibrio sp. OR37 TaxID=1798186 RepID=UPI0008EF0844|nr:hypothetical protein [Pseudobutyrivibrio sp. OR37]SFI20387.1 hypothetical protein SAMN04487830_1307 [Pseudobutyrivibrio sp. OR37]
MKIRKVITFIATMTALLLNASMPQVKAAELEMINEHTEEAENEAAWDEASKDETVEAVDAEAELEDAKPEDAETENAEPTDSETEDSELETDEEKADLDSEDELEEKELEHDEEEDEFTFSSLTLTTYQMVGLFDDDGNYYEDYILIGSTDVCDEQTSCQQLLDSALECNDSKNDIEEYLKEHISLPEECPETYNIVIYFDINENIEEARAYQSRND